MKPRFPVYIVSKGRWKRRPTANALDSMGVDYKIIIEEQEFNNYNIEVAAEKLLILPKKYLKDYDTFWERSEDNKTGPGPARNFAWDHSIESGFSWHWVLDDNMESFERFNNNLKIKCKTGTPFYVCEDFALRYENVAQAGMNYSIFMPAIERRPPIKINTRIYSCLLIRNDTGYRWRGRYNEDTDLSIRMMKDGWCTIQFNSFLCGKRATQTVKGGNTEEFYEKEGTLNKSQMLVDMHPDITKLTKKFNRWHHHVNYNVFKTNLLIKKNEFKNIKGINNYGMKLIEKTNN